jgi:hypothetical protein
MSHSAGCPAGRTSATVNGNWHGSAVAERYVVSARGRGVQRVGLGICWLLAACTGDTMDPRGVSAFTVGAPLAGSGGYVPVVGIGGTGGTAPIQNGGAGAGGDGRSITGAASGSGGGVGGNEPGAGAGGAGMAGMAGKGGTGFDAGTDPARNAVGPGMICERLATIECAAELACCTNPGRDVAACRQAVIGSCTHDFMADTIAMQAAAGFDSAQAKVVLDHLEQLASQCDTTEAAYAASPEGLRSIFRGTVGPNGMCQPANPLDTAAAAGALASCTNGDAYACLPSPTGFGTWTCTALASPGGHCFSDINCQLGLFCDNPNLQIAGSTCMARKASGTSCQHANECESLVCKGGQCAAADQQAVYCLAP